MSSRHTTPPHYAVALHNSALPSHNYTRLCHSETSHFSTTHLQHRTSRIVTIHYQNATIQDLSSLYMYTTPRHISEPYLHRAQHHQSKAAPTRNVAAPCGTQPSPYIQHSTDASHRHTPHFRNEAPPYATIPVLRRIRPSSTIDITVQHFSITLHLIAQRDIS